MALYKFTYLLTYLLTMTDKLQRLMNAAARLVTGRRAFSVTGPTVWNSLPDSL